MLNQLRVLLRGCIIEPAIAGVALERPGAFVSRDDTIPIVDCGVPRSHVQPEWSMPSSMQDRSVRTSVFHRPHSVATLRADEEVSALSGRVLPRPIPTCPLVERNIPPSCPSRPVSRVSRASQGSRASQMFEQAGLVVAGVVQDMFCLLYTSPSPRDGLLSRMPSSA